MSGSEQFLGRQLAIQAEKMALLVEKMQLMVVAQENSVPKFAKESDNLKITKDYADISFTAASPLKFTSYVNGVIRIRLYIHASTSNCQIKVNGTYNGNIMAVTIGNTQYFRDLVVKEGDAVEIIASDVTPKAKKIEISYDLAGKPTIVI